MIKHISYEKFKESVEKLGLLKYSSADEIRRKYKKLTKKYHPDMKDGDSSKFKDINEAYAVVKQYIDNYRFKLDKDEFKDQYPMTGKFNNDWLSSKE